jgi:hypothetical protein
MLGSQRGQIHRANVPPVDQEYKLLFPDRPYASPEMQKKRDEYATKVMMHQIGKPSPWL